MITPIPLSECGKIAPLVCRWNLDVSRPDVRRQNIRWFLRRQSETLPKGKGNRAWKRFAAERLWELHLIGNVYIQ